MSGRDPGNPGRVKDDIPKIAITQGDKIISLGRCPSDPVIGENTGNNTTGYGPENINVSFPGERKYYIRTHYFSDRGGAETRATVSIYVQGELVETLTATLPTSGHRWKIGYVEFAETGIGTFYPEDEVEAYSARSCPDC